MTNIEKVIRERLDETIVARFQGLLAPLVSEIVEFSDGVTFSLCPDLEKDSGQFDVGQVSCEQPLSPLSYREFVKNWLADYYPALKKDSGQFDVGQVSYEQPSSPLSDKDAAKNWLADWYPGEKGLTKEACIAACSAPGKGLKHPLVLAAAAAFFNMPCTTCRGWSAKDCEVCSNKGINTCKHCKGKGFRHCPSCNGHGGSICKRCLGRKSIKSACTNCNGSGSIVTTTQTWRVQSNGAKYLYDTVSRDIECPVCAGAGGHWRPCDVCAGNGSHWCKTCGRLWSVELHSMIKCDKCHGSGEQTCSKCNGYSLHRPCKLCNNSGIVIDYLCLRQSLRMRFDSITGGGINAYCLDNLDRLGLEDSSAEFQRFASSFNFLSFSKPRIGISRWLEEYCRDNIDRAVLDDCVPVHGKFSVRLRLTTPLWVAKVSDSYFKDLAFVVYDPTADIFYGLDQIEARASAQRRSEEHVRKEALCAPLRAEANAVVTRENGRPAFFRNYGQAIRALRKLESLGDNSSKKLLDAVCSKDAKSRKSRRTAGFITLIVSIAVFILVDRFGPEKPTIDRFSKLVANLKAVTPPQEQAARLEDALVATLAANPSAETEIAKVLSSATSGAVFGSPSAMALLERRAPFSQDSDRILSNTYLSQCREDIKVCRPAATLFERAYREGKVDSLNMIIRLYWMSGDIPKTIEWLTLAVEAGVGDAAADLAFFYQEKVRDCKKAQYWRGVHIRKYPAFGSGHPVFAKKPGGCF